MLFVIIEKSDETGAWLGKITQYNTFYAQKI